MADLFDKIKENRGELGKWSKVAHGYFSFPKLEGEINNKMIFRGKEVLQWSLNIINNANFHDGLRNKKIKIET